MTETKKINKTADIKAYRKNYYEQNKQKKIEYMNGYNEQHRDALRENGKMLIYCESCGIQVTKYNASNHRRSKKHLEGLKMGRIIPESVMFPPPGALRRDDVPTKSLRRDDVPQHIAPKPKKSIICGHCGNLYDFDKIKDHLENHARRVDYLSIPRDQAATYEEWKTYMEEIELVLPDGEYIFDIQKA